AAAVEVHDHGLRAVALGGVDAHRDVARLAGDDPVLGGDLLRLALQVAEALGGRAGLGDGHVVEGRHPLRLEGGEQLLGFGVDGHVVSRSVEVGDGAAGPPRQGGSAPAAAADRARGGGWVEGYETADTAGGASTASW